MPPACWNFQSWRKSGWRQSKLTALFLYGQDFLLGSMGWDGSTKYVLLCVYIYKKWAGKIYLKNQEENTYSKLILGFLDIGKKRLVASSRAEKTCFILFLCFLKFELWGHLVLERSKLAAASFSLLLLSLQVPQFHWLPQKTAHILIDNSLLVFNITTQILEPCNIHLQIS